MTGTQGIGKEDAWSVILSGGEGERIRPFIEDWLGYHKPKQYCTFVGRRSLFQRTVDRADRMASPKRRVAVIAAGSDDVREWLRAHYSPRRWKQLLAPLARRAIRGRAESVCAMQGCDCTWCRCAHSETGSLANSSARGGFARV